MTFIKKLSSLLGKKSFPNYLEWMNPGPNFEDRTGHVYEYTEGIDYSSPFFMGPTEVNGKIIFMCRTYSKEIPLIPDHDDKYGVKHIDVSKCPVKDIHPCRDNPNCYSCYYYVKNCERIRATESEKDK